MVNQNEVPTQEIPNFNFQVNDKLLNILGAKFVPPSIWGCFDLFVEEIDPLDCNFLPFFLCFFALSLRI